MIVAPDSSTSWSRIRRRLWQVFGLLVVCFLITGSLLFVDETESVIVERLGSLVAVYDQPEDRGLHFKLPWPVEVARRFDRRVQLFTPPGREMFTRDKKNLTVDTYLCWKIATTKPDDNAEPNSRPVTKFFRTFGSLDVAQARLESRVRSALTSRIGQLNLTDLLSVESSEQGPDNSPGLLETLSADLMKELNQAQNGQSLQEELGLEIVDLRIRRINLPLGNHDAVFERMRSERKKIADEYRSAGMAEHQMIQSQADRQASELLSRANAEAERIRGEAEAEAVAILNQAHAEDPEFYQLLRSLDAYRKILGKQTTLVLSASSPMLKLLTQGIPNLSERPLPDSTTQPEVTP